MTFYEAVIAPCAAIRRDAIRVAQLIPGESVYECFAPEAFKGWGTREIPVLLDHDRASAAFLDADNATTPNPEISLPELPGRTAIRPDSRGCG